MNTAVEPQEQIISTPNAGFGTDASAIVVPKAPSMFGKSNAPFILDMDENKTKEAEGEEKASNPIDILSLTAAKGATTDSLLTELAKENTPDSEDESDEPAATTTTSTTDSKAGRPKTDKNALANYIKTKIEAKEFEVWDDYDEKVPLEEYLAKQSESELQSLIDSNWKTKEESLRSELKNEIFESLPGSLQYIAAAVSRGATEEDLRDMYAALLQVEETRALDITDEHDQEAIAYNYLQLTKFGDQNMIREQVDEWKNDGKLEGKAKAFKPKLDQMQEQQVQYRLQQQEEYNRQQAEMQQYYTQNIYESLKKGDIGGLKLDRKQQQAIYERLTNVQPSPLSGKPVNSLGAKLEEIQFSDKPNYDLLVEVDWLLNDREGYRKALIQLGKNEAAVETERKLKSAQVNSSKGTYEEQQPQKQIKKGLPKQVNIF